MKKLKLTRVIASTLVVASVIALNPIGASAEWRYNSTNWWSPDGSTTGWWYSEGSSWATGWRYIDGKWYYFDSNGYMNANKTVDGYKLGSDGAWLNTSGTTTSVTNESDFEFDAKTGTITKYVGNHFEIVIPSTINGVQVKSIGDGAFYNFKNITSIEIQEGVKNIGNGAFDGCIALKSIKMPKSITSIGDYAFGYSLSDTGFARYKRSEYPCKDATFYVKSEKIKNLLENNGVGAYNHIILNNETTDGIIDESDFSFDKNTGTLTGYNGSNTNVVIPNKIDGVTVKSIGGSAFYGLSTLKSVTIPNSVTSIEYMAFYGCGLNNVTIPDSVTSIKSQAFSGCSSLTSITLSNNLTSIDDDTFTYCQNLKSVIIPESVTRIGNNAFLQCSSLTSVTIPSSVTRIGVSPFFGCEESTFYVDNNKTKQLLINADVDASKIILNGESSAVNTNNTSITSNTSNTSSNSNKSNQVVTGKSNDEDDEIITDESDREISTEDYVTDKVTSITLNKTSLNIVKKAGIDRPKLKVEVSPSTVTSHDLIWKSSNEKVAVVDFVSGGVEVVPIGKGTATITCTSRDGSNKSATCEVTVTE